MHEKPYRRISCLQACTMNSSILHDSCHAPGQRFCLLVLQCMVMPHLSNVGMFDAVCHRPTTPLNGRVEAIRRRISALLINQRSSNNKVHRYCYLVVSAKTTLEKKTPPDIGYLPCRSSAESDQSLILQRLAECYSRRWRARGMLLPSATDVLCRDVSPCRMDGSLRHLDRAEAPFTAAEAARPEDSCSPGSSASSGRRRRRRPGPG